MKDGVSFKLFSPFFITRKSSSLWITGPPISIRTPPLWLIIYTLHLLALFG